MTSSPARARGSAQHLHRPKAIMTVGLFEINGHVTCLAVRQAPQDSSLEHVVVTRPVLVSEQCLCAVVRLSPRCEHRGTDGDPNPQVRVPSVRGSQKRALDRVRSNPGKERGRASVKRWPRLVPGPSDTDVLIGRRESAKGAAPSRYVRRRRSPQDPKSTRRVRRRAGRRGRGRM